MPPVQLVHAARRRRHCRAHRPTARVRQAAHAHRLLHARRGRRQPGTGHGAVSTAHVRRRSHVRVRYFRRAAHAHALRAAARRKSRGVATEVRRRRAGAAVGAQGGREAGERRLPRHVSTTRHRVRTPRQTGAVFGGQDTRMGVH